MAGMHSKKGADIIAGAAIVTVVSRIFTYSPGEYQFLQDCAFNSENFGQHG